MRPLHSSGLLRTPGDDLVLVLMSRQTIVVLGADGRDEVEDPRDARFQLDGHPKINDG